MSHNDDEFKNVKKGLPDEISSQKTTVNFVAIFTVIGLVFGFVILVMQDSILNVDNFLKKTGNNLPVQLIVNLLLAFLVGCVQAWIFKGKIKSRTSLYIMFSALGGLVAGIVVGVIMNAGFYEPIILGLICGGVAGGVSSWGQNNIMGTNRYRSKWLTYSIFSWAIIYSLAWVIGWKPAGGADMVLFTALSGSFLMIAQGVGLAIFVHITPQIEFS